MIRRASLALVLCLAGPALAQSGETPAEPAAATPPASPPAAPAVQPAAVQPAAVQPAVVKPGAAVQPDAVQPAAAKAAVKPGAMIQPAVAKPAVVKPAVAQPGLAKPAAATQPAPGAPKPAMPGHPEGAHPGGPPKDPTGGYTTLNPPPLPDISKLPKYELPKGVTLDPSVNQPLPTTLPPPPDDNKVIMNRAKFVFGSLLLGDPRPLVDLSSYPFMMEDRRIGTPDELYGECQRQLRQKRPDLLTLYGIEILSAADLEKKYGKPPPRLANFPRTGGKMFYAVANLSGRAAIAVFREDRPHDWRIVGYHD